MTDKNNNNETSQKETETNKKLKEIEKGALQAVGTVLVVTAVSLLTGMNIDV